VLFVGRAQEKTGVFRTEKRINPTTGAAYPWLVRRTAIVNHFYVYALDEDFGPFFIKFCTYFPYNAKVCLNGNEWAKRQAAKAGIGFEPLDNGFASCENPTRLQRICDQLNAAKIDRFVRKWLARLPHPFTAADRRAGYRYDQSILQAEFSLTQTLDRPLSGRVFFEEVIRENLDIGRPDRVSLIFDRRIRRRGPRPTPGRFRTRVFTDGVVPSLHVEYKSTRVKQYHKQGVALRTETTINNTRDFGIGKRLHNLPALREVGFSDGFANRDLRAHLAPLLGVDAETMTAGRMTYDLRRLRLHGLIERIPHTHRYQVTNTGLRAAVFFTRAYNRFIRTGLAELNDPDTPSPATARLHRAGDGTRQWRRAGRGLGGQRNAARGRVGRMCADRASRCRQFSSASGPKGMHHWLFRPRRAGSHPRAIQWMTAPWLMPSRRAMSATVTSPSASSAGGGTWW
jgi:hypothetical protein